MKTRDFILNKQRESLLKVLGTEVQIVQDLPTTLLRKRKDSDFLRQTLQKKNMKYRWRIPFTLEVQLSK